MKMTFSRYRPTPHEEYTVITSFDAIAGGDIEWMRPADGGIDMRVRVRLKLWIGSWHPKRGWGHGQWWSSTECHYRFGLISEEDWSIHNRAAILCRMEAEALKADYVVDSVTDEGILLKVR